MGAMSVLGLGFPEGVGLGVGVGVAVPEGVGVGVPVPVGVGVAVPAGVGDGDGVDVDPPAVEDVPEGVEFDADGVLKLPPVSLPSNSPPLYMAAASLAILSSSL